MRTRVHYRTRRVPDEIDEDEEIMEERMDTVEHREEDYDTGL